MVSTPRCSHGDAGSIPALGIYFCFIYFNNFYNILSFYKFKKYKQNQIFIKIKD